MQNSMALTSIDKSLKSLNLKHLWNYLKYELFDKERDLVFVETLLLVPFSFVIRDTAILLTGLSLFSDVMI